MASWIYSLARNKATNRDESNQGYPSKIQGNQDKHNQELRAENQKLRARMGMMETQMIELKEILLALKNEGITVTAKENFEGIPSVTTKPVHITFAENSERVAMHHVPDLVVTPRISPSSSSPVVIKSQIQGSTPRNTTHSRDPHVNPALVSVIHLHEDVNVFLQDYPVATPQGKDKCQLLKERPKRTEKSMEAHDPSLALFLAFELPDFVKFEGMTCPATHATIYLKEMLPLTNDDRLLTYCFQSSLTREALSWYLQEHSNNRCWDKLVDAFMKRFDYNKAPSRAQLQNMAQRNNETFREYTLRWRDLVAQVKPPLLEKEMVDIFIKTLPPLYYDQLVENVNASFGDLVLAGESLENGVKKGKIAYNSTEVTPIARFGKASRSPKILSRIPYLSTQARKSQKTPNYPEKKPRQFNPISMSYSDLFDHLVCHDLIFIRPMKPYKPPFPRGYDPDATCKFHAGAVGHSVENCKALKHVIQDLIDSKQLDFNGNNVSDLPASQSEEANVRMSEGKSPQYDPSPVSYTDLCSYLISRGWVTPRKMRPVQPPFPRGYDPEATCKFHLGAIGHSVENCSALKNLVRGLIDTNQLTVEKGERSSSQGLWTIKTE